AYRLAPGGRARKSGPATQQRRALRRRLRHLTRLPRKNAMSQILRPAAVASVVFGLFLVSASAAVATPPTIFPFPSDDATLSGICNFDVNLTVLEQNETLKIFSDGSLMLTGTFKVA